MIKMSRNKSLEVFYKKKLLLKSSIIHRKNPELESLCNKNVPTQVFSCEYWEMFKATYFEERLRTAASKCRLQ